MQSFMPCFTRSITEVSRCCVRAALTRFIFKLQEPLPDEMNRKTLKELYDFYIRMINIQRNYEVKKNTESAHQPDLS